MVGIVIKTLEKIHTLWPNDSACRSNVKQKKHKFQYKDMPYSTI